MRAIALVLVLRAVAAPLAAEAPPPAAVAVLYNSAVPESRQLAELYRDARAIPLQNLIGLAMPLTTDISRADYDRSIRQPLLEEFDRRGWWRRGKDVSGTTLPVRNQIKVLVVMRGVPLRIQPIPKPPTKPPAKTAAAAPAAPPNPFAGHDEAAVDSELAMFGVDGLPLEGALKNMFYQSSQPLMKADQPFLVLTARIDAASYATCARMIRDAVAVEKTGLWGMAYVDIANKYPQGDQWLEAAATASAKAGIPTVVDRFNDTLPTNYPMGAAAFYFGWYDWNVSGPFLNPRFQFRPGAVALHLHSFSAEQLSNPAKNWCAPLLDRGAAVTVGNVYEPYLHLTHDFGIIQQRLLAGDCWVEACWKAMPVTSWQGVVLGDPLYQPFLHLDGGGQRTLQDNDFRALRAAALRWPDAPAERRKQLDQAAARTASGVLAEAVGLDLLQQGYPVEAAVRFRAAKAAYVAARDQLRQDFHLIAIDRAANRKDLAVRALRDAQLRYGAIPEAAALQGWLNILEPPPPPAAPARVSATKAPAPAAPHP